MDISNFLFLLKKEYREVLFSFIIGFPLSYLDCWFMYPIFREWDVIPQIFISAGICVISISIGVVISLCFFAMTSEGKLKDLNSYLNFILIVFPLVVTSALTLLNDVHSKLDFASIFIMVSGIMIVVILFLFIRHKSKKKKGDNREQNDRYIGK